MVFRVVIVVRVGEHSIRSGDIGKSLGLRSSLVEIMVVVGKFVCSF